MKLLPLALILLCLPGNSSVAAAQTTITSDAPASLAPGDIVRIAVWRRPEFSGDFVVSPDSSIAHPLMREIRVVAVPLAVVEDRVRAFLTKFDANPSFVVSPLLRVFVGGEVRIPNVYNAPPGSTVPQLIALAGGPTERGQLEKVIFVRRQQRAIYDLVDPQSPATTLEVRSGDQIIVERRHSLFTEVIVPTGSLVGAAAAILTIFLRH